MNALKLKHSLLAAGAVALAFFTAGLPAHADVVTDWNAAFEKSLLVPAERGPRVPVRTLAIMHVAMFDAVNGIDCKYEPYLVTELAPSGARADAAAIQAAYTVLTTLLPSHQSAYDAQLQLSLAALAGHQGNSVSIERGRAWGAQVAQAIIAARASDGASDGATAVLPPFVGQTTPGYWRHAPLGASPTAGYANLATIPFVVPLPADGSPPFDVAPPYGFADRTAALASAAYAADVNEVKARGGIESTVRTAADLELALFIDACDLANMNGVLRSKVNANARLVDTAREFALFNMTAFDTQVVFFRIKYRHAFWRPFQAIRYADLVENAAITKDETWTSRIPTPPHPEYISAHVTYFTSMLQVAARLEGDSHPVDLVAAASAFHPGGTKSFASLAAISNATVQARIDVGYHFRETGEISQIVAREIGNYVVDHALLPKDVP
jgi:hypothetical protein